MPGTTARFLLAEGETALRRENNRGDARDETRLPGPLLLRPFCPITVSPVSGVVVARVAERSISVDIPRTTCKGAEGAK